ncbi:MAG: tetratricopeptide repeat protein [Candidatus Omnitrophica bacterium]|nr:tetratricopeptide repeat protein [Candidatus Omnitrophota bacterium]MCM8803523.1 tetratricopeptide repeat protein [Candidatus Omnitrophota bacterium]
MEEAKKYENEGNIEKAFAFYQKTYENSKEISEKKIVLLAIARLYEKQKRYEESLETYKKCLDLASTSQEVTMIKTKIANCYIYQKQPLLAINIYDEIIKEYPKTEFAGEAQFLKANIYHRFIKDYEKAINEYEKLIKEYPNHWSIKIPHSLQCIANCYWELKKYEDAIKIFERIITNYPNTSFEKYAKLCIEFINEYDKKGKTVPPEVIMKRMKEIGLSEGIVSVEIKDNKVITEDK